jgi:hypothetical protein
MTTAGLAGDDAHDAGAASGVVNTAHQLGSALGLGILTAAGAAAVPAGGSATAALVGRVSTALTGCSVMLAAALLPGRRPHRPTGSSAADRPSRRRPA